MKKLRSILFIMSMITFVSTGAMAWNTPVMISPVTTTQTWAGVTLDWSAVHLSAQYQLQVDLSPSFNTPQLQTFTKNYINSGSGNADTEHFLNNILFDTAYYWRVRAYIAGDTSAWSSSWYFITRNYVTMNIPVPGTVTWCGTNLNWNAHPGVAFYDVQVDTSLLFNSPLLQSYTKTYINSSNGNTDTEHDLVNTLFGTKYYWRLRARNTVDTTAWSAPWDFTTRDYVTKNAPSTGASTWSGTTLNWDAHPGVGFYDVEADTSLSFNSPALQSFSKTYINSNSGNADTEQYLTNTYFGTKYYWRVRARTTIDTTSWSSSWNFTTRDYVNMNTPTTGTLTWSGVTLDWYTHTGVGFYDVQADTTLSFNSPALQSYSKVYINSNSGNADTEHYLDNTYFGTKYYWRVRVRNTVDTSSWNTPWDFTTRDYVTMNTPFSGTTTWSGVSLDWLSHPGVGFYDVEADTTLSFNSPALQSYSKSYINSNSGNADTEHYLTNTYFGTNYYWRVRVRNTVDTTLWSTPWEIHIRDFVTMNTPVDGQLNVSTAGTTLNWAPHPGISVYQMQMDTVVTFNSPLLVSVSKNYINSTNGNTDTENSSGPLNAFEVYYWRVRAYNTVDTCSWTTWYFSTGDCQQPGVITGANSLCSGSTSTYSVSNVVGATSYIWNLPSGWSGTSTTNSISVTVGSTGGTVSVYVLNACGSSQVQTLQVMVAPAIPAQPGAISGNVGVCNGSSQTYSIAPVAGAASYIWSVPSGWTGSSTSESLTVTAGSTNGTISVIAVNGCGSSVPQTLNVTSTSVITAVNQQGVVLITAASGAIYQWIDCNNGNVAIPNATGQIYTATYNGSFAVIITQNGCTDTSLCFAVVNVGVEETPENSIVWYPNPTSDYIFIESNNQKISQKSIITLSDITGKIIFARVMNSPKEKIDISELTSGIYVLTISSEDKIIQGKIVKRN